MLTVKPSHTTLCFSFVRNVTENTSVMKMATYQLGKIFENTCSVYQDDSAGSPNMPMAVIKYRRSNADKVIKSFVKVSVKLEIRRFSINTIMLKMFPITPMQETKIFSQEVTITMYLIINAL